jgi:hypothetical protein
MLSRSLAVPTLLAASVAVPYVATNAPEWRNHWNAPSAAAGSTSQQPIAANSPAAVQHASAQHAAAQHAAALAAPPSGPGATLYPAKMPLEGTPTYSVAEVLRMDVTKEWVYQRWPRKSTALAELDLYGIRVPLVTGTQLSDIAGSLTYYFGADGRVQRISFRGLTGDTTQLVGLVTQRYGLQAQPSLAVGEQLFEARRDADVLSRLRTRPAPVLWASSPHDSFSVELDLQDAATARPLAPEVVPLPALPTQPATPVAQAGAADQAAGEKSASSDDAEKKPAPSGWKAFFPRRNLPAEQIQNLDHGNMYQ